MFNAAADIDIVQAPYKGSAALISTVVTEGLNEPAPQQGLVASQKHRADGRLARRMCRLRRVPDQAPCAHRQDVTGVKREQVLGSPPSARRESVAFLQRCLVTTTLPPRRHQPSSPGGTLSRFMYDSSPERRSVSGALGKGQKMLVYLTPPSEPAGKRHR